MDAVIFAVGRVERSAQIGADLRQGLLEGRQHPAVDDASTLFRGKRPKDQMNVQLICDVPTAALAAR
jgi:hypothetical protein